MSERRRLLRCLWMSHSCQHFLTTLLLTGAAATICGHLDVIRLLGFGFGSSGFVWGIRCWAGEVGHICVHFVDGGARLFLPASTSLLCCCPRLSTSVTAGQLHTVAKEKACACCREHKEGLPSDQRSSPSPNKSFEHVADAISSPPLTFVTLQPHPIAVIRSLSCPSSPVLPFVAVVLQSLCSSVGS